MEIARLRRCIRCEQRPIGLEVEQRCVIQAIQAAHRHNRSIDRNQLRDGCTDWIWPGRRPQWKGAARSSVVCRALHDQIAPREVPPIKDFDALELSETVECLNPRLKKLMRQNGPSARPCRGVSIREVHGVRMRPINIKPASVVGGIATATSAFRISFSRTTSNSAFVVLDATICDHSQCRQKSSVPAMRIAPLPTIT